MNNPWVISGSVVVVIAIIYYVMMGHALGHCPYYCPKCEHFTASSVCEHCRHDQRGTVVFTYTGNVASEEEGDRER